MKNKEVRTDSMYRLLCDNMAEGFCVVEVLFDEAGAPHDCVLREVNDAFERQSGLVAVAGRRISEIAPEAAAQWVEAFAGVARSGQALQIEQRSQRQGRWYEVRAFRWGAASANCVGVLFSDITQRKLDDLMAQSVVEYAIILLDPEGRVRTWNAGAQRIKGYAPQDIIGRHFSVFYSGAEDIAKDQPRKVLALAAEAGRFDDEGWRVRRDGSRFWASVALTPLRDADGQLQGYAKVTRDLSERRLAEEALRAQVQERIRVQQQLRELNGRLEAEVAARTQELTRANAQLVEAKERLQELSARLIQAQEDERGRIARELHDDLGQLLTLMRIRLADAAKEHASAAVEGCTELVNEAIEHTRRLAMNLRPSVLDDLGLDAALEWMLGQQAAVAGWSAGYHGSVGEQRFPDEVETACFRIAQEALTNAARYARASEISVALVLEGDQLLLSVADNGRGFDVERSRAPAERARHFGLVSMQERASLVGATLAIESAPGRGTRVTASFPLRAGWLS
ncbi:PAS domain S-box protein [Caenimonas terrae]|uniref:histidine kinase n=1 Tax=Caenimonas terrae TaxID=696074 RepID=A0ABW0NH97_9BURK